MRRLLLVPIFFLSLHPPAFSEETIECIIPKEYVIDSDYKPVSIIVKIKKAENGKNSTVIHGILDPGSGRVMGGEEGNDESMVIGDDGYPGIKGLVYKDENSGRFLSMLIRAGTKVYLIRK